VTAGGAAGPDVPEPDVAELDVAVVGAGFAGLYAVHRLRSAGLRVRAFERGGGVGGTWYWNRYPGARCDVESLFYCYTFSDELYREWRWTERYPAQPEILAYLEHVADRFDLRRDIELDTAVTSVEFDDTEGRWTVGTEHGDRHRARFVVMATGCLSSAHDPRFPGQDGFAGQVLSTSSWPAGGVDLRGRRVAQVGTGSSGIQVGSRIAAEVGHLYVLQRTPNYSIPAWNAPLPTATAALARDGLATIRELTRASPLNLPFTPRRVSALDEEPATLRANLEAAWATGGVLMSTVYPEVLRDERVNAIVGDFVAEKTRARVHDPAVAERLVPKGYPFAAKRLCVDTGYFEIFNRDNVTLVDLTETPIERVRPEGVQLAGGTVLEVDTLLLATGFDAMTGSLLRAGLTGRAGLRLRDAWAGGPRTYLGLAVPGFPNLFTVAGPGSPAVLSNMVPSIELHVDWIADAIAATDAAGARTIEATPEAAGEWTGLVDEISRNTLYPRAGSWYTGANIPGKRKGFLLFAGGTVDYRRRLEAVAAESYRGFTLTP
jgi:cation diffusion facilitator CzcD-associated flavoprotein CzcO